MQEIIIAGIIAVLLIIAALYAKAIIYFVPKARRAVLFADFGVKPVKTKNTGIHLNFRWPWVQQKDEITTEVLTMNIPSFTVNVRSDPSDSDKSGRPDAGIDLYTGEESFYYTIDISAFGKNEEESLRNYYNLLSPNATWVEARERIEADYVKDPFQTLFREKIEKLPLTEARAAKSKIMKQVQAELQKYFEDKQYPFKIRSITSNVPLNFVKKDEEQSYFASSKAKLDINANIYKQEAARVEAELQVEISRLRGMSKGVEKGIEKSIELTMILDKTAAACGITVLALGQQKYTEAMMTIRGMEITQKLYENQAKGFALVDSNMISSLVAKIFEVKSTLIK
ncbi:MAG: hypothetical protein V1928_04285 [Parcubacteria group bacterium]